MDQEMLWAVVQLMIFLPVVAALAYFTVKYGLGRRYGWPGARRYMRVVEQLPFGPRAGIALVQVGREYLLIGFHDGKLTLLKEFAQLPEELPAEVRPMEIFRERSGLSGSSALFQKFLQEKINFFKQKK